MVMPSRTIFGLKGCIFLKLYFKSNFHTRRVLEEPGRVEDPRHRRTEWTNIKAGKSIETNRQLN